MYNLLFHLATSYGMRPAHMESLFACGSVQLTSQFLDETDRGRLQSFAGTRDLVPNPNAPCQLQPRPTNANDNDNSRSCFGLPGYYMSDETQSSLHLHRPSDTPVFDEEGNFDHFLFHSFFPYFLF